MIISKNLMLILKWDIGNPPQTITAVRSAVGSTPAASTTYIKQFQYVSCIQFIR